MKDNLISALYMIFCFFLIVSVGCILIIEKILKEVIFI